MSYESTGQLKVRNRIRSGNNSNAKYGNNTCKRLTYHHTASKGDSEDYIYSNVGAMSVHYLIKRSGEVVRFAYENVCCWHAGRTRWDHERGANCYGFVTPANLITGNADMLGIEIEHASGERHTYDPEWGEVSRYYPVAQLRSLDMLAADIYSRHPTILSTVSHKEIAYPRPPWASYFRKPDPEYMEAHMADHQIDKVRARLNPGGGEVDWSKNGLPLAPGGLPDPTGLPQGEDMVMALSGARAVGYEIDYGRVVLSNLDENYNRVTAVVEDWQANTRKVKFWKPKEGRWEDVKLV